MREAEIILPNMRGASATSDNRVHLLLRMNASVRPPQKAKTETVLPETR